MKKMHILLLGLLPFLLLFVTCAQDTPTSVMVSSEPNNGNQVTLAKAAISTNPVLDNSLSVVGSSKLTRNTNGVSMTLQTTGLEPGSATTNWWVVWNAPENCLTSPCTEDDLFNSAVVSDVIYAAGNVVGGAGKSAFAAYLSEGDNSGSIFPDFGLPAPGLIDAETAEIHLVVRSHGQAIPGLIDAQIHSFGGGCSGFPPSLGTPGPNTCEDIQFAIHLP